MRVPGGNRAPVHRINIYDNPIRRSIAGGQGKRRAIMKQYEEPKMTIIALDGNDIVRTSETNLTGGGDAITGEGSLDFGDLTGTSLN